MSLFTSFAQIPFASALLLVGIVGGIFVLTWGFARLFWPGFLWIIRKTHMRDNAWLVESLNPLSFFAALSVGYAVQGQLHQALSLNNTYTKEALNLMIYVGLAWFIFKVIDIALERLRIRFAFRKQGVRANMLPLLGRTLKGFLSLLILVQILQNAGVDVGGLITGLGIGGLALALAGQKTIENLFGGIMLVMDQPFRVGDFVKIDDLNLKGTVEDIGWRSSRIRTLEKTIVTIPNAMLSEKSIDNFSKRQEILFKTEIGVRYDTSPDQLRYLLINIRKMLLGHPKVSEDPARVRFMGFGEYTLNIEIFCYLKTNDYNESLAIKEDIYLRLMTCVAEAGTDFAFPTQTEIQEEWIKPDKSPKALAEQEIVAMRENNTFLLPDMPEKTIESLKNTLEYPEKSAAILKEKKPTPKPRAAKPVKRTRRRR